MDKRTIIATVIISIVIVMSVGLTVYYLIGTTEPATETTEPVSSNGESYFPSSGSVSGGEETTKGDQDSYPEGSVPEAESVLSGGMLISGKDVMVATNIPVAGITFVSKNNTAEPALRYIEKGTGHIKDISFSEKLPTKISNTTMTGIYDAIWGHEGATVILKKLNSPENTVQFVYGTIESSVSSSDLEGSVGKLNEVVLPSNILDIAVSPDKTRIFYLVNDLDSSVGLISDFTPGTPSDKKTKVWTSPFKNWNVSWPIKDTLSMYPKPSSTTDGHLYSLLISNSKFSKLIGDIKGLTAQVSPSGKNAIYSESTGTGFVSYWRDLTKNTTSILPIQTLPEKCVWSKISEFTLYCGVPSTIIGNNYPDSWYQGVTSFSDGIIRIDLDVNTSNTIAKAGSLGRELDVTKPILSEDENFMAFINKKDGTPVIIKLR